ncbi:MAG: TIR domain-containing protein, partial [Actinomycetota bacterium]|nr:TIR domain-containing protein [Actinomycetota bacterium]
MGLDSDHLHELPEYDVCLSFAGEDREFVHQAADALKERGVRVFYDEYEKTVLWGKDLFEHLDYVYRKAARYCVLFVSSAYAEKLWTNHERRSAQARAFSESSEYILPARFDDTEIPDLTPTVGYIDLTSTSPQELAQLVADKLGPRSQVEFFPPRPDHLWEHFGIDLEADELIADDIHQRAHSFFEALRRMEEGEREVVFQLLLEGCPAELPE